MIFFNALSALDSIESPLFSFFLLTAAEASSALASASSLLAASKSV
jgi:hypothetical protein